jgi:hypothetical protein
MLIRALNPFDTQLSYRSRKSAVAAVVVAAVAAGGDGLKDVPLLTTSAQVQVLKVQASQIFIRLFNLYGLA